jgi:hypothetical protein
LAGIQSRLHVICASAWPIRMSAEAAQAMNNGAAPQP